MMPSGTPTPGRASTGPFQAQFSSVVSPRTQFGNPGSNNNSNMALLGNNISNASSLLSPSHMNLVGSTEPDPCSFTSTSGQLQVQNQQVESTQSCQQQFSVPQQQYRGGLSHASSVKVETDQSFHNLGSVKLEAPSHLQTMRNLGSVKLEPHQHSEQTMFLQQQQQQQHLMQLSRQSSQAAAQMNLLQQQQMLRMQQQQQQLIKTLPSQRPPLQQQQQQQGLLRPQGKPAVYEPGMCARRLTHYMYHQQHRPADNNIEFWRKFVNEYFAPHAKKRWCVSLYGSGRQTSGVFPQDVWHCEICNRKPGRGFETTVEVLPRLCKIKYDSGTLEELLYVDMPREYQNASGQIVLDYAKAIQESVFEQLRVVRDGQLRIVFNSDLKICSWEFCARRHEELIPRRLIVPQVSQLGSVAQKYQAASQNSSSNSSLSSQDFQNTCNSFVASARHLAKALEVPLVNDLGYTKRYVRCLQISEVVNSMKDLIDYSREIGMGPMASLINFPRATPVSSGLHDQVPQQLEDQQGRAQISNQNEQNSVHSSGIQHPTTGNGVMSVNNSMNTASCTTSASTIAGLLHQNSMNLRQENPVSNMNGPYGGGSAVQISSASSSTALPQPQANGLNQSSSFPSTTLTSSNNASQGIPNNKHLNTSMSLPANVSMMQRPVNQSNEADTNDAQSSVQQIIQEMMMTSHVNVDPVGNDMKGMNGITPSFSGGNSLVGNGDIGVGGNSGMRSMSYGSMSGLGNVATATGIRPAMMSNASLSLNGRGGVNQIGLDTSSMNHQQQNFGNRLLGSSLGKANSFNNLNFDWRTTP